MRRIPLIAILLGLFMLACSSSGGGDPDGSDSDGTANGDQDNGDSAGDPGFDVTECVAGETKCPGALECRCCGAIGPRGICICSKQCYGDLECQGTDLPFCNMAEGAKSGICTPEGFNCCWDCQ